MNLMESVIELLTKRFTRLIVPASILLSGLLKVLRGAYSRIVSWASLEQMVITSGKVYTYDGSDLH